ncbi:hypothetical protein STEG23_016979 [Scotinomys teguina]
MPLLKKWAFECAMDWKSYVLKEFDITDDGDMVTYGPKLLLMAMSGSIVLLQVESVVMSIAGIITNSIANHVLNKG